jgi:hypothetical protein
MCSHIGMFILCVTILYLQYNDSRFFTLRTISEGFFFEKLDIINSNVPQAKNITELRLAFMNDTVIGEIMEKKQFYICFIAGLSNGKKPKYSFSLLNRYQCWTKAKSNPLEPDVFVEEDELVEKPFYPVVVEFFFELLRYMVIIFLVAYIKRKLLVISRSHTLVSNSLDRVSILSQCYTTTNITIVQPQFYQNIVPYIPVELQANHAIWESVWIFFVHIFLYTLMIITVITPYEWPKVSFSKLYTKDRLKFLSLTIPVIVVNVWCTVIKIFLSNRKTKYTYSDQSTASGKLHKAIRIIFSLIVSLIAGSGWLVYVIYAEKDLLDYVCILYCRLFEHLLIINIQKLPIHIIAMIIISILLTGYLSSSPVYKLNKIIFKLFCCNSLKEKNKGSVTLLKYYLFLFSSLTLDIFWIMSLVALAFNAGAVATHFIWSTMSNFLLNADSIKTYSYAVSIVATFYKFSNDIDQPYNILRDFLVADRPCMTKDTITNNNINLNKKADEEIDKDSKYISPMTWIQFTRLAEMANISTITNNILAQGLLSQ